ncbi:UNKNOWN [Stylonychia lemnae]|uniref:RSE1/DDB1/CPSF1 C-terminal domain-containing protein n=1 Tax=Stylonychia lemnae TaxID=5949 RepID=A0A078AXL3_STYLE|nr:UNKNOWN [Stylonychia lemnae]|eukprot:CDW87205.1 UNKNOWN [Stylonychia lemnae]
MYPYIATLKHPTIFSKAFSANLTQQTPENPLERRNLILQYPHELQVFQINSMDQHDNCKYPYTLLFSQPIYAKILAIKRIKPSKKDISRGFQLQDYIFMLTGDKLMHILKYSNESKQMETLSELQLDFGRGQQKFEEVAYITYDELTKTVVIVFKGLYQLIVELEQGNSSSDSQDLSIKTYTLCELDIQNFIKIKKIVRSNPHNNSEKEAYLAVLYDGVTAADRDDEVEINENEYIHLSIYQVKTQFELDQLNQYKILTLVYDLQLGAKSEDQLLNSSYFVNFSYSTAQDQLMLFSQNGVWLYSLDFTKYTNKGDNFVKFIPLNDLSVFSLWLSKDSLIVYGQNSTINLITLYGQNRILIDELLLVKNNLKLSQCEQIVKLNSETLFITSSQQNHQILNVNQQGKKIEILSEIENNGSLAETKYYQDGSKLMLQKGQNKSKIYLLDDHTSIDSVTYIPLEYDDILLGLNLYGDSLLISTQQGSSIFNIKTNSINQTKNAHLSADILIGKNIDSNKYASISHQELRLINTEDNSFKLVELDKQSFVIKGDITDDYCAFFDNQNQLNLYQSKSLNSLDNVKFGQDKQIHDISLIHISKDLNLLVVCYWNVSKISVYRLPNIREPIYEINLLDFINFQSFQIDKIKMLKLNSDFYLLVALTNGFLLSFNFYPQLILNLQTYGLDPRMMIRLSNIKKIGDYIHKIVQLDEHSGFICSDNSQLIFQDLKSKVKSLSFQKVNCIIDENQQYNIEDCLAAGPNRVVLYCAGNIILGSYKSSSNSVDHISGKRIDFDCMVQKFDYIDDLKILIVNQFDSFSLDAQECKTQLISLKNDDNQTIDNIKSQPNEYPSTIFYHKFNNNDRIIFTGHSIRVSEDDQEFAPNKGILYVHQLVESNPEQNQDQSFKAQKLHQLDFNGAIVDIQLMQIEDARKYLIIAVNQNFGIYSLQTAEERQNYSLIEDEVTTVSKQTYIYRIKTVGCKILVADIMRSLSIYTFNPEIQRAACIQICRDPLRQWCMDMIQINENHYLISDYHYNITILSQKSKDQISQQGDDQIFNVFGGFYMGQQVNSINLEFLSKERKNDAQRPEDAFLSHQYLQSQYLPKNQSFFDSQAHLDFNNQIQNMQAFLATSDGGLTTAIFLEYQAYIILKYLQEQLDEVKNSKYKIRNFRKTDVQKQLEGIEKDQEFYDFIDGDFIEQFLEMQESDQINIVDQVIPRIKSIHNSVKNQVTTNFSNITFKDIRMLIETLKSLHQ